MKSKSIKFVLGYVAVLIRDCFIDSFFHNINCYKQDKHDPILITDLIVLQDLVTVGVFGHHPSVTCHLHNDGGLDGDGHRHNIAYYQLLADWQIGVGNGSLIRMS